MLDGFSSSVRIGAELNGRLRVLRGLIDAEDRRYTERSQQLLLPVRNRLHRMPGRNIRPQLLADLEAGWHADLGSDYRLSCSSQLSKRALRIDEVYIVAATFQNTGWADDEPAIGITHGLLLVDRTGVSFCCRLVSTFSRHALARRLQRSACALTDADLLTDVAACVSHTAAELPEGHGFSISTRDGGRWAGRCVVADGERLLAIRTWLSA